MLADCRAFHRSGIAAYTYNHAHPLMGSFSCSRVQKDSPKTLRSGESYKELCTFYREGPIAIQDMKP
ncbi:hypothetical protein J2Z18_000741 [Paenibacillus lactis]|uniref:Uncharacterized protein n=2 Tax=Paenibacillus lactis TaxID=228574 RepID=G4HH15_9BACL|nr:hypothetical protein PaelaDRAFT_3276 [Paenibacillus lactis 154]MBP1891669.1 hypothetical protein [Paenibacillus lactis]